MPEKLYRFLLVDDEEIIRDGISGSIDWDAEGFDFLPPCVDGVEAMDRIRETEPDIVLTDICMPRADGLEVARFIHENYPDTLALILSGYDDFEYAQKAMSFQVMDYILKPISSRSLKKHLARIRQALSERDENREESARLMKLLDKGRSAVRDRFLSRLLAGRVDLTEIELLGSDLDFLRQSDYFGVICIEIDHPDDAPTGNGLSADLQFLLLEEISKKELSGKHDYACISTEDNRLVVILGRPLEDMLTQQLSYFAEDILAMVREQSSFSSSAGVGLVVDDVGDIFQSYRQAVTALQYRLLSGSDKSFVFRQEGYGDLSIRLAITKCCDNIRRDIRIGRNDDALKTAGSFIATLKDGDLGPRHARMEIVKFLSSILDALEEVGIAQDDTPDGTLADRIYSAMDVDRIDELDSLLKDLLDNVACILEEKRDSFPRKKLNEIIRYLEIHYADSVLSTETVAERFFISSGYLTKLFRRHMDKSFLEYLNSLKMDRAQELLKTSDMRSYEIAEQLGFKDPHYFSSSFKKYFGMTPREYRKSL